MNFEVHGSGIGTLSNHSPGRTSYVSCLTFLRGQWWGVGSTGNHGADVYVCISVCETVLWANYSKRIARRFRCGAHGALQNRACLSPVYTIVLYFLLLRFPTFLTVHFLNNFLFEAYSLQLTVELTVLSSGHLGLWYHRPFVMLYWGKKRFPPRNDPFLNYVCAYATVR